LTKASSVALRILAQNALEGFIHDFFAAIDDNRLFSIVATPPGQEQIDHTELGSNLHEAQLDWQDAYSARPSVAKRLLSED
jgi:hypothetical protein